MSLLDPDNYVCTFFALSPSLPPSLPPRHELARAAAACVREVNKKDGFMD